MKYFTHPKGTFVIKIPVEWQYKNVAVGYEEKSPFSFEFVSSLGNTTACTNDDGSDDGAGSNDGWEV